MDLQRRILQRLRDGGYTSSFEDLRPFLLKSGEPLLGVATALNDLNAHGYVQDQYQSHGYRWAMGSPKALGRIYEMDEFNVCLRITPLGLEYLRTAEHTEWSTALMRKQSKTYWIVFYLGAVGGAVAIAHALFDVFKK